MGDRANIVVEEDVWPRTSRRKPGRVWLYGHWIGDRTLNVTTKVIQRGDRLTDESYLARIIFEAMIPDDQRGGELSYGISTRITDNEHPIIVFRPGKGTVQIEDDDGSPITPPIAYAEWLRLVPDTDDINFETAVAAIRKVHPLT